MKHRKKYSQGVAQEVEVDVEVGVVVARLRMAEHTCWRDTVDTILDTMFSTHVCQT